MTKVCAMFGSARTSQYDPRYERTEKAANYLAKKGWTIATGGGPGLMEAANKGAKQVCPNGVCSLGYSIYLPFEAETNDHVQEDHHHKTFFTRLEEFAKCDAFIALHGGYGTLLEILTVVQLIQVEHMPPKPLILVGSAWLTIMERADLTLKQTGVVGIKEGPYWQLAKNPMEAAKLLIRLTNEETDD